MNTINKDTLTDLNFGSELAENLLEWYAEEHRKLPWRESHDPYKIWLSEVMLQQTQVDTVIPYFNRYIEAFPTIQDLASASEEQVLKLWEGLGYYSRAKRIRLCAMEVVEKYDGVFPEDYNKVLKLPGIGSYTAGAVLSIAYNMAVSAVDGNVLRVFSRLENDHSDIGNLKVRKALEARITRILPHDRRHYNQALMELGATICTPKNPKCNSCPVAELCESRKLGNQADLPVKKKKQKNKQMDMEVALVYKDGELLMMKRPSTGLLADLWGFPIAEKTLTSDGDSIMAELDDNYGLDVLQAEKLGKAKHVFSHRTWNMTIYKVDVTDKVYPEYPSVVWCTEETIKEYALPTAFKKVLK